MDYTRQMGILDPENINYPVTLVGYGGIGSPTALALAKVGCPRLTIIDHDSVEEHNRPSQFFRNKDIGRYKVEAGTEILNDFTECQVTGIAKPIAEVAELSGIVISGVDTMAVRQEIWDRLEYNTDIPLYIDGRIGGEIIQVYTIEPCQYEDIMIYKDWLFPDDDAAPLPCTERAIIHTGLGISSFICSQLKKWINGEQYYRRISFDFKTMTMVQQHLTPRHSVS